MDLDTGIQTSPRESAPSELMPFDYKDVYRLNRYVTDRGKILPQRITGLTRKKQKELERAIKRSRKLALLPYTIHEVVIDFS